jgi:hypothetical protein
VDAGSNEPEALGGLTQSAEAGGPAAAATGEEPADSAEPAVVPEAEGSEPSPAEPEAESGDEVGGGSFAQTIVGVEPEPEGEATAFAPQLVGLMPEQEGVSAAATSSSPSLDILPEAEGLDDAADPPAVDTVPALVGAGLGTDDTQGNTDVEANGAANAPAPAGPAMVVDQVMADAENGVGQEGNLEDQPAVSGNDEIDSADFEAVDLAFETSDLWLLDA